MTFPFFRSLIPGLVNIQKAIENIEIVDLPIKNDGFP
jgi:hypothetical protein